ncbi:MAG: hypothetical protein ACLSVD_06080, partial [Eggerthellaceae bacterium]
MVKLAAAYALVIGCLFVGLRVADSALADQSQQQAPQQQAPDEGAAPAAYEGPSHVEDWNLVLVNPWNELPEGYDVTLA